MGLRVDTELQLRSITRNGTGSLSKTCVYGPTNRCCTQVLVAFVNELFSKVRESCYRSYICYESLGNWKLINWNLIIEPGRNCIKVKLKIFKRSMFFSIPKRNSKILTCRWKLEDDPRRESFLVSPSLSSPLEIKRERQPFLSLSFYSPTPPLPFEIEDFPQVKSIRLCYEPGRNSLMERTTLSIAGCAPRIFKEATLDDEGISGREGFFHWIFYVVIWAFY